MILELGCGGRLYPGAIGVDHVLQPYTAATVKCDLGFNCLPFDDDSCDLVLARHIIEHIPESVRYLDCELVSGFSSGPDIFREWKVAYPLRDFFNEVYRVLKDNACLYIECPIFPSIPSVQDPQHVTLVPMEKFNYYSGDYYSFHDVYGHTSRFQKSWERLDFRWLGRVIFQAVKSVPDNTPYQLKYESLNLDLELQRVLAELKRNEVLP